MKKNLMKKEMKTRVVFVILNYETYWETIACIESIYETIGKETIGLKGNSIVLVDNGSQNDSVSRLCAEIRGVEGIYLLQSKENLGFAKGNNLGFKFAKKELDPDFIIMSNSDILMIDENFTSKLDTYYSEYQFAVAAPDAITPNGKHLNPYVSNRLTIQGVEQGIRDMKINIALCKIGIEPFIRGCQRICKRLIPQKERMIQVGDRLELKNGLQLHGCFLIFSRIYIEQFDGIFDKTFLYGEEVLLRIRCQRAKLEMYILPKIKVIHNESRTEKFLRKGIRTRHMIRYTHYLDSLYVIKEYMESGEL